MASKLQQILPIIWSNVEKTIADVEKGTASTHGYAAFFKTNENKKAVQDVYRAMVAGDPVDQTNGASLGRGRSTDPDDFVNPGIICLQDGDPGMAEQMSMCNTDTETRYLIAAMGGQ